MGCANDTECHVWMDNTYFCVQKRCMQLYCQNDEQCPGENDRCINQNCLTVNDCKTDMDCGDSLVCNLVLGVCTPIPTTTIRIDKLVTVPTTKPECIQPSDCQTVKI